MTRNFSQELSQQSCYWNIREYKKYYVRFIELLFSLYRILTISISFNQRSSCIPSVQYSP